MKAPAVLLRITGILLIVPVLTAALLPVALKAAGLETFVVVSDSMVPAVPVGSLVAVRPVPGGEAHTGDIIAFRRGQEVIVHRVAGVSPDGSFITKGDASEENDPLGVYPGDIIGREVFILPSAGRIMEAAGSRAGRIVLIAELAAALVLLEASHVLTVKKK